VVDVICEYGIINNKYYIIIFMLFPLKLIQINLNNNNKNK
jgi:hypothetical protein